MKTSKELHEITLRRGLSPIEKVSVSAWADRYRVLSAGNAEPGRWRTSRVPYMRAVMDAFTDPAVEKVVVKSAAQVGKSEVLLNVIGRYASVDPATIMIIQPTLEMATDFSKSRLTPMINDSKGLKALFYGRRSEAATRDANQTLLSKFYVGGRVVLAGANSPAGLASRPIRILLCDEVDRFPPSASSEGDPLSIAARRTSTYWNRKIGIFSTPTIEGISRIDVEYELGTKEHWAHRCPNCGEFHTIDHRDMTDDVKWRCPDCGFEFDELTIKRSEQKYVAERSDVTGVRSFFISGFYSPWVSWTEIMREWSEARGKPELEKVVYNTRFGLSYELKGDYSDESEFVKRLERYDGELPSGVLILTAGVDVQANRLEYEIVGWGAGEECWGIVRGQVFGSTQEAETWRKLDEVLDREYAGASGRLKVYRTFVDSGYLTSIVYEYCARRLNAGRFPIKGYGSVGRALIYKTVSVKGVPLTLLGVNEGKAMVYNRLSIKEGEQCFHFGRDDEHLTRRYDETYFKQLISERRVLRRTGGLIYETYEPISRRQRNEALDLRVYALAAMKSLGIDDWTDLNEERKVERAARSREVDIW
ncbi:MAG: phage terminase large subunit family protein [Selenomonadaceae bacterium]|nr:phage terminase large subunit family protein [Selenomonadaceae bacterium]